MVNTKIKLTREQKEVISLLSIDNFLEYFDLLLYIYMAAFLNKAFFPKADPKLAAIYLAIVICLAYLLKPIGFII